MRSWRGLRLLVVFAAVVCGGPARAHDFERTQVTLTLARDGSFVLDVANDAAWLEHRLIPFRDAAAGRAGGLFADRIVLFVDGHEVRPASIERVPTSSAAGAGERAPLATYRMRGRFAPDARSLRWYYGLPIDPYPLTVHRADGRIVVEEIAGDAWSRTIDLTGQFRASTVGPTAAAATIAAVLLVPVAIRLSFRRSRRLQRARHTSR